MDIKAFNGMHPEADWYNGLMNSSPENEMLRGLLEPSAYNDGDLEGCRKNLSSLLENGQYSREDTAGIYVYEKETPYGSQFGIWTLTSLQDMLDGKIVPHERTLLQQEERLKLYRDEVGIEGSPVVLTYRRHWAVHLLIEKVSAFEPVICLSLEGSRHKVWKIRDLDLIREFEQVFQSIDQVYVADGHHRLAAASAAHQLRPAWISTLYVSSGQIQCREFHRLVAPKWRLDEKQFFSGLKRVFFISPVPNNVPYKPSKLHRLGMFFKGNWYQLDLKTNLEHLEKEMDVLILQEQVLNPLLGIEDPGKDSALSNFPADRWDSLVEISKSQPEAVIFTLFPMTAEALILQAQQQRDLPPKSTYIEPRVPFGLLLYQNKVRENSLQTNHI